MKFVKDEEDIFKKYSLYEAERFVNKDAKCEVENTDQKDGMTPLKTLDQDVKNKPGVREKLVTSISKCSTFSSATMCRMRKMFGKNISFGILNKTSISNNSMELCSVKNMSCNMFPSKAYCTGISVGKCTSRSNMISNLFTVRIIMSTVIYVFVTVVVTLGLTYWFYTHIEVVDEQQKNRNES